MQRQLFAAKSVFLCLAAAGACAQGTGGERKWYLGLDVGQAKLDHAVAFEDQSELDDTSTAWTLRVGYQFNRYFALEGGYTNLGDFDAAVTPVCIPGVPCQSFGIRTSIDGFLLNAVGTWPISGHFELNCSGGLVYRELELSALSPNASVFSTDDGTETVMKLGIGAGFPIDQHLKIALELSQYRDTSLDGEGESTVASLGVRWTF